jgi:hypothetical protein
MTACESRPLIFLSSGMNSTKYISAVEILNGTYTGLRRVCTKGRQKSKPMSFSVLRC